MKKYFVFVLIIIFSILACEENQNISLNNELILDKKLTKNIGTNNIEANKQSFDKNYLNELFYDDSTTINVGKIHTDLTIAFLRKYSVWDSLGLSISEIIQKTYNEILLDSLSKRLGINKDSLDKFNNNILNLNLTNVDNWTKINYNNLDNSSLDLYNQIMKIVSKNEDNAEFVYEINKFKLDNYDNYDKTELDIAVQIAISSFTFWNVNSHLYKYNYGLDRRNNLVEVRDSVKPEDSKEAVVGGDVLGGISGAAIGAGVGFYGGAGIGAIPGAIVGGVEGALTGTLTGAIYIMGQKLGWWGSFGGGENGSGNKGEPPKPTNDYGAWVWDDTCGCWIWMPEEE